MKKKSDAISSSARDGSRLMLKRAHALMTAYSRATGSFICIHDKNYMPTHELFEEMMSEKNICLFCARYKKNLEVRDYNELCDNPCRDMHVNAIRESYRFGGSYTYVCSLGFMFWTSPFYLEGQFAGALMASGFLGTDSDETYARMHSLCKGTVSETQLRHLIGQFPRGQPQKIKAMAELLLICAQSLSVGSGGCHAAMKRRAEQQADLSAKIEELKSRYPCGSRRPEYPLEKEQEILEALRRGDSESVKQILNEFLAVLLFSYPDQFKHIQYRAMELAVLLFRMDTSPGFITKTILEVNNQYMKSIQKAGNIEELSDALYQIADEIAGRIISFQGIQHASALKKAEHFILENFTRKISLDEIAGTLGFSAPYFSTIFKEEMGENLSSYLNRLRVEKASYMLTETNMALNNIARSCGFEDQSWFSKIFKLYTGMSPGKYRNQGERKSLKIPEPVFSINYPMEITA